MTWVTTHQKYLTTVKAKTLCNALINSKFYYASLISMLARKLLISKRTKQNKKNQNIFDRCKWYITNMTQLMMNYFQ